MRVLTFLAAPALVAVLSGCASTNQYASACERDYAENRQRATAGGALLGAAVGAAIDDNDARGAAIGAAAGGLLGRQLSREDDPCGYGFGGYMRPGYEDRYGYGDRRYRRGY